VSSPSTTRVRELLASQHLLWWVLGLAVVLGLPSLGVGLFGDDLPQYSFLRAQHSGTSGDTPWWNMFALVEGPRERTIGMRTAGRCPWWTDPDLRIVFFRPVSVATHHLDHWLWPNTPWLMHMHSVLWHALACGLAWALARRVCSNPAAAGIAALIYVGSFSHTMPVAWLAHRNGVVSTAFALGSLLAHDRWRRDNSRLGAVAAPALLGLSLLAAEAGIVTLAFSVAYALFLDRSSPSRRALALVPSLVVIAGWRLIYDANGFGAIGSGAYLDPIGDPIGFLTHLPERYFWLLGASVSPPLVYGFPSWLWWTLTGAIGLVLLVFLALVPSRPARFGATAVLLGCVPLTASHPGDRLLILASFGIALSLGELLATWLLGERQRAPRVIGATTVLLVHLLLSPALSFALSSGLQEMHSTVGTAPIYGPDLPNEGLERKGLVIVHAPNYTSAEYLPAIRVLRGLAKPNFVWLLHEGPESPDVRRIDERTLEVRAPRGWPSTLFSAYWRSPSHAPFAVGETIKTIDYVATIKEVERGKATVVEFRFRAPLEHPTLVWATWSGSEFVPVDPRSLPSR
jgi:hypothetical protein